MSFFDVCFHTKVGRSSHVTFTDYTKHASAGSHSSTTYSLLFDFYTNKTEQHLQTETLLLLIRASIKNKASSVAYYLGETQTCNHYYFLTWWSSR